MEYSEKSRRELEQSGEVLSSDENVLGQSDNNHNKWEEAMKNVPTYEEHMEQIEAEEQEMEM